MRTGKSDTLMKSLRGSSHSLADKQTPDQRIAELLLANNASLLAVICQTYFVGDAAATVSVGVLSLLRRQRKSLTETFLKKLLCGRIEEFRKDLNDIIRDNSMATMLLNAYARYEGLTYLGKCLAEPIQQVLPLIEHCELDAQKLPEHQAHIRDQNEANLKEATLKFLDSIISSRHAMPSSIKNMCFFLFSTIETLLTSPHPSITKPNETKSELEPGRTSESSMSPKRSQSTPFKSEEHASRTDALASQPSPATGATSPRLRIASPLGRSVSDNRATKPPSPTKMNMDQDARPKSFCIADRKILPLKGLEAPDYVPSAPGSQDDVHNKKTDPLSRTQTTSTRSRSSSAGYQRTDLTALLLAREHYNIPPNPSSVGVLSVAEKIVGSFLFLRFIVPAITSPDNYGLLDKKVSSEGRRGLVLIGKILTALCNDVDFGNKESYLTPLNPFLKENRVKIKEFLNFVSSFPPTPIEEELLVEHIEERASVASPSEHTQPKWPSLSRSRNTTPKSPPHLSHLVKNKLSASLPSLKPSNSYPVTASPPLGRTRSTDFDDSDNFFMYLGKSLYKIEKDLEEKWGAHRQTHPDTAVLFNSFLELKKVLENSPYTETGAKKKNESFFSRIGKVSTWFNKGRAKSKSMEELSSRAK